MKKTTRLFAVLLAVVMFAAVAFTVSAFDDVKVTDDCFDAVNTLTALGVVKGKTETTFAPGDAVTREQMAALIYRLYTTFSDEGGTNNTPFSDIDDAYYNTVITWCFDSKVINGTSATTFEPKANIVYQDALTMICRLLGYTDLTYPLGYITKARLVGLSDGLEGVAFDKELTRGETAIILYNALDAECKELIKENKVKWYYSDKGEAYPISESVERNFTVALDVYKFKKQTFQVVGTENFAFTGYTKATSDSSYVLASVDTDTNKVSAKYVEKDFEDIAVLEGTNSDDAILGYIEILYKGDSLDDRKAVVLSSVIISNFEVETEVGVYYKKNVSSDKLEAQPDKITIGSKTYNSKEKVYVVNDKGVISPSTGNLAVDAPVFYQTVSTDQGKYAQNVYDVDKDGIVDYVMFFPMTFQKVTAVSSKGVYTIKNIDTSKSVKYDTLDENNILFFDKECAKDDYILTYNYGEYVHVAEVVEPIVTYVQKATSTTVNGKARGKYTLATGDAVYFSTANNPVVGLDNSTKTLSVSNDEIALYVINDKIVYTDSADSLGYTPYTYAFIVNKGDDETQVDMDDGTIETVSNLIAFINGKAVTIPTDKDYSKDPNWPSILHSPVTVKTVKDGKYVLVAGLNIKDAEHEIRLGTGTLSYYSVTKLYTLTSGGVAYRCDLDANSEIYVQTNNPTSGKYESVKRYTMSNVPSSLDGVVIKDAIVRKNADSSLYTLVVAYSDVGTDFSGASDYSAYRIVLSRGLTLEKGKTYETFEVLNPFSGTIETLTDNTTEIDSIDNSTKATGSIVKQNTNGAVVQVSSANQTSVLTGGISGLTSLTQVAKNGVINNSVVTFYKDTTGKEIFAGSSKAGSELIITSAKVVILTINDNNEFEVKLGDADDLNGKVVRMYTTSGNDYRAFYVVAVPYEWAKAAGYTELQEYDEYKA